MVRKYLFWFVAFPLALMIALFAAINRATVSVSFWPFPREMDLPVFLLFLGSLAVGLILGALGMWLSVLSLRVKVYNREMEIRSLKRDLDRTHTEHRKLLEHKAAQDKALPPAA